MKLHRYRVKHFINYGGSIAVDEPNPNPNHVVDLALLYAGHRVYWRDVSIAWYAGADGISGAYVIENHLTGHKHAAYVAVEAAQLLEHALAEENQS